MDKNTYRCTGTVRHDGKVLDLGDPIDLDEKAAAPLLLIGSIATEEGFRARAEVAMRTAGIPGGLPISAGSVATQEDVAALKRAVAGVGSGEASILPEGAGSQPEASDDNAAVDALIEKAIHGFGPGDFTKDGEPRMSVLTDAVQTLAYPDGGGGGIIVRSEDRDRVFKAMTAAEFEVPQAKPEGDGT